MTTRAKGMALLLLLGIWGLIVVWLQVGTNEPQRVPLKFVSGQSGGHRAAPGQSKAALRVDLALLMANRQNADAAFIAPKNIFRPLNTERETVTLLPPSHRRESRPLASKPLASVPLPAAESEPPSPLVMTIPSSDSEAPAAPSGPTPQELARQAGREELAQYRYLGYLIRGGTDEAFLSKGNDLHIVKAGETIDQHVLVKAIAPTGVILQETTSQVEHIVALLP